MKSVTTYRSLIVLLLILLLFPGCGLIMSASEELTSGVKKGDYNSVQHALERGADPNMDLHGNETPLGILIQQYRKSDENKRRKIEKAVASLLDRGADPNALHHGFTPLMIATGQDSPIIVSRLLTYGANPSLETRAGLAPIWQAVYDNNHQIGYMLLVAGANPNALNTEGQTPLEYLRACGFQKRKIMLHLRHFGGQ